MIPIRNFKKVDSILLICVVSLLYTSCGVNRTSLGNEAIGPLEPFSVDGTNEIGSKKDQRSVMASTAKTEDPMEITLQDSILLALENNRSLKIERLNTSIQRTLENEERAAFDPKLSAEVSKDQTTSQRLARAGSGVETLENDTFSGRVAIEEFLPTGTTLTLEGSTGIIDSSLYSDQFASSRIGLTITQSLLRGFGTGANLAKLRQARLDTRSSQYELRGFAEVLVAQLEKTYWDYTLAKGQMEIYQESLNLAQQQLRETQEMITVGNLAESEITTAQAEIAVRRQDLINARSTLAKTHILLLRLLNLSHEDMWNQEIILVDHPLLPEIELDKVETHVALGLRMRPDLNQARLEVDQGNLEVLFTKNGLLPKMDFFITLGKTGYADSFNRSLNDINEESNDLSAGISIQYPFGNRGAQSKKKRALHSLHQAIEAVNNLGELVETDIRSAYIEVHRTKDQISATKTTRKLQEEKLRIETEKFRVGRSTMFLIAQAQRDLVSSQILEVQTLINHLKALIDLYRLEGSLLERRGISAPGQNPVKSSKEILPNG